ncbi:TRAP transporter small permease [Rhodospirillaceae bacterium]|jgi:TRAP-type C4-dicarboxylate transport system permease small subunit|nr:TRAP transporter small permease [Rhodospirillaceae bacterium]
MLESIHSRLERISQLAVWVGGAALLAAALMVTVDVLSRKIFNVTMSGSDEYSGYVFSATTTWAYSYCLLHRSNVRIDALYNYLPRKVTAILDVVGLLLLFYFMSIMTYYAMVSFVDSWVNNSVSITTLGTPQWIPQLFWVAGLILFFVTLIFVVVYSIIALLQRNWDLVARVAGVPSIAETMQEETHGIDVALVSESSAKAKE